MGCSHSRNGDMEARKEQAHWWGSIPERGSANTRVLDAALPVASCVTLNNLHGATLKLKVLSPTSDIRNQNLHFSKIPR